ncbi:unnamed protein product [Microthlaspi erraticum]|uniref:NYN domain-containing protein n=1 Tax=Microthlaspi erraticum TaxID=1685480 RepID=A0A6D2IFA4_9BRAS|nr:unnamed protein product [Microthlaspi erraticum]
MTQNKSPAAKKTVVWWDMNTCPPPEELDPYQIRQSIESAFSHYLPFTISAHGNLKAIPPGLLESILSSGIILKHGLDGSMPVDMKRWRDANPPPARLILISDCEGIRGILPLFKNLGYTIIGVLKKNELELEDPAEYASLVTFSWDHLLSGCHRRTTGEVMDVKDKCSETAWLCKLCINSSRPFAGESYESLTRHFNSAQHSFQIAKITEMKRQSMGSRRGNEAHSVSGVRRRRLGVVCFSARHFLCFICYLEATVSLYQLAKCDLIFHEMMQNKSQPAKKTVVWWDMNTCPPPEGLDPNQIRQSLESTFPHLLPFTISAHGDLKVIPRSLWEPILSSGILLKHGPAGSMPGSMPSDMTSWRDNNPPPARLILISDCESVCGILRLFTVRGYTITCAVKNNKPEDAAKSKYASLAAISWDHILSAAWYDSTSGRPVMDKCSETAWVCNMWIDSSHPFAGESYESLTRHMSSALHSIQESIWMNPTPSSGSRDEEYEESEDDLGSGEDEGDEESEDELDKEMMQTREESEDELDKEIMQNKKTGVWWDMDTCPRPQGLDTCPSEYRIDVFRTPSSKRLCHWQPEFHRCWRVGTHLIRWFLYETQPSR